MGRHPKAKVKLFSKYSGNHTDEEVNDPFGGPLQDFAALLKEFSREPVEGQRASATISTLRQTDGSLRAQYACQTEDTLSQIPLQLTSAWPRAPPCCFAKSHVEPVVSVIDRVEIR